MGQAVLDRDALAQLGTASRAELAGAQLGQRHVAVVGPPRPSWVPTVLSPAMIAYRDDPRGHVAHAGGVGARQLGPAVQPVDQDRAARGGQRDRQGRPDPPLRGGSGNLVGG